MLMRVFLLIAVEMVEMLTRAKVIAWSHYKSQRPPEQRREGFQMAHKARGL